MARTGCCGRRIWWQSEAVLGIECVAQLAASYQTMRTPAALLCSPGQGTLSSALPGTTTGFDSMYGKVRAIADDDDLAETGLLSHEEPPEYDKTPYNTPMKSNDSHKDLTAMRNNRTGHSMYQATTPAQGCLIDLTGDMFTAPEADLISDLAGGPTSLHGKHSVSVPDLLDHDFDPFSSPSAPAQTQPPQAATTQQTSALHKSASANVAGDMAQGDGNDAAEVLRDFEEEDGTRDTRELLLYAIPLYQDEVNPVKGLVFLPVSNFCEDEPVEPGTFRARIKARVDKMVAQWDALKEKEEGTLGKKIYKVGHSVANDLTPEERLTRNIPKNVTKVIIYHPSVLPPDVIFERLSEMTDQQGSWSSAKAAAATFMLPIAFGIDILVIPGPQVLTYYTGYQLYKNARAAVGNQRLTKLIKQSGDAAAVRVNYAGDVRLDGYWEAVREAHDGVLDEESCEQLVRDIEQPELLEPILELRKRRLKELGIYTAGSSGTHEYSALRSNEVDSNARDHFTNKPLL